MGRSNSLCDVSFLLGTKGGLRGNSIHLFACSVKMISFEPSTANFAPNVTVIALF